MALTDKLKAIGDAIRAKTGGTDSLTLDQMVTEIRGIETGVDTSDATATASDILADKTAYVNGEKVTGTMANNGGVEMNLTPSFGVVTAPAGYYDGVNVGVDCELLTVTPTEETQNISGAHSGDTFFEAVTVNPIPDGYLVADELTTQDTLLTELETVLAGKAAGGGVQIETATLQISCVDYGSAITADVVTYADNALQAQHSTTPGGNYSTFTNVVIGSYVILDRIVNGYVECSGCEPISDLIYKINSQECSIMIFDDIGE